MDEVKIEVAIPEETPVMESVPDATGTVIAPTLEIAQTVGRTEAQMEQHTTTLAELQTQVESLVTDQRLMRDEMSRLYDRTAQIQPEPETITEPEIVENPVVVVDVPQEAAIETEPPKRASSRGFLAKILLG